jgi:hypothetical protein
LRIADEISDGGAAAHLHSAVGIAAVNIEPIAVHPSQLLQCTSFDDEQAMLPKKRANTATDSGVMRSATCSAAEPRPNETA